MARAVNLKRGPERVVYMQFHKQQKSIPVNISAGRGLGEKDKRRAICFWLCVDAVGALPGSETGPRNKRLLSPRERTEMINYSHGKLTMPSRGSDTTPSKYAQHDT